MLVQAEKFAQAQRISILLGSAGSYAADFSQAPLKVSYFSLMMMFLSVHAVIKWGIASLCPAFMGGLFPVHCTGLLYRPAMLKIFKTLAPTKILALT
jgi:hypothetical protein